MRKLIHDKEGVYMIDEECLKKKEELERTKEMQWQYDNTKPNDKTIKKRRSP